MVNKDLVNELIQSTKEVKLSEVIEREKFSDLLKFMNIDEISIITGVRRSGKSTIMLQLLKKLKNVPEENILYINFEDERLINLTVNDLEKIYQYFIEINNPKGKIYFFLDEIQEIKYWEKWIRRRYESKNIKFIITGSNASLLSSEFATALTGRNITFDMFPFSFKEYLKWFKIEVDNRILYSSKKPIVKRYFNKYLKFGGFPKIAHINEKQRTYLLQRYFTDILYKDIVKRFRIKDVKGFEKFVIYLLTNISNTMSYYSLRNTFGFSVDTIKEYISYLRTSYLIFEVSFFSFSLKEQQTRPRKIYCIDTGLRNAISFKFSEDLGRLAENIVFLELKRKDKEIYYWKSAKTETDFVIKEGMKIKQLIQVCWNIEDKKTKEREIKGLLESMKEFHLRTGLIITEEYFGEEKVDGKKIKFVPLWKWLLED